MILEARERQNGVVMVEGERKEMGVVVLEFAGIEWNHLNRRRMRLPAERRGDERRVKSGEERWSEMGKRLGFRSD